MREFYETAMPTSITKTGYKHYNDWLVQCGLGWRAVTTILFQQKNKHPTLKILDQFDNLLYMPKIGLKLAHAQDETIHFWYFYSKQPSLT